MGEEAEIFFSENQKKFCHEMNLFVLQIKGEDFSTFKIGIFKL